MKARHIILSVTLVLLVFGLGQAAPHLSIREPVFDFGIVPQHAKVSHTFWLKNTGDDTLKILKVVPGWGCTQAPLEKADLAVGDSTRLEIIFSTKTSVGEVTKSPKITTNEGGGFKTVRIMTNITRKPDSTYPLVLEPSKLEISQFGQKAHDEAEFTIKNVSEQELTLTLIDAPVGLIDIKLPKKIKADSNEKVTVKLTKDGIDQKFEKSITIEANDSEHTRYTIPIKRILGPEQSTVSAGEE